MYEVRNMENIKLDMNNKQKTLEMIYERTYAKAYVIARQFVKNDEDALDIVQEAYISVFNNMESLKDETKLDKWVNMIVANRCKDWLRKKQVILFSDMGENEDSDYEESIENDNKDFLPEESVDYAETKRLMAEILAGLPEDQRMCVLMYYYDELSVGEIAESLECSTGTVKSRLNYARKKIKDEVEALERKGTKLYGIAPLPFIIWMLKGTEANAAAALNHTIIVQGAMGVGSGAIGKASLLKQVATTSGKVVVHSVRNKILVGALTLSLIGGGSYAGYSYLQNQNNISGNDSDKEVILKDDVENKTNKEQNEGEKELTEEDYLEAYQDILSTGQFQYYAFVDLDGKGMPELLLGKEEDAMDGEDGSIQMQKATLFKHTESGSEELQTIGKVSFVLMYNAKEKKIEYTAIRMNGAYVIWNTYYYLNEEGQLEIEVLGTNLETMKYYYGKEMHNPEYEITEKEYDEYMKTLGDTKEILFKKLNIEVSQVQYIEYIYQTIEEDLDIYTEQVYGEICVYSDSNDARKKVLYYPILGVCGVEEAEVQNYILEFYYDTNSDNTTNRVLTVVTNTQTEEVYKYYHYKEQIIRYVDCNQNVYEDEKGECYVDTTTVAYILQQGFHD